MPRRRNDAVDGQPAPPKARTRKKKDSASVCGTPTGEPHKLEQGGVLCANQISLDSVGGGALHQQQMQNMQQHGGNLTFIGPSDDGNMSQPPIVAGMPPFGHPQPHSEYFYNQQQHPGPFPLPIYGMSQAPPAQHNPQIGHANQFGDQEPPQPFIFHHQQSPSQPSHVPIPQTVLIR